MVLIPQEVLEMDFADLANITNEDNSQVLNYFHLKETISLRVLKVF